MRDGDSKKEAQKKEKKTNVGKKVSSEKEILNSVRGMGISFVTETMEKSQKFTCQYWILNCRHSNNEQPGVLKIAEQRKTGNFKKRWIMKTGNFKKRWTTKTGNFNKALNNEKPGI
jgi:hypothetical protein